MLFRLCSSPLKLFPALSQNAPSFRGALYYLCQRSSHGSIRPSWKIQIVTGLMWAGSLHMPSRVFFSPSQSFSEAAQVEDLSLRLPLSFVAFVYLCMALARIRKTHIIMQEQKKVFHGRFLFDKIVVHFLQEKNVTIKVCKNMVTTQAEVLLLDL